MTRQPATTPDRSRHLVVAGLLRREGCALLVHRAAGRQWYPNCWDLPGGHVEGGETPQQALRRELQEELGVRARVAGGPDAQVRGEDFRMDIWLIDQWEGAPENLEPAEHDALAWLTLDEAAALDLAHPHLLTLLTSALV